MLLLSTLAAAAPPSSGVVVGGALWRYCRYTDNVKLAASAATPKAAAAVVPDRLRLTRATDPDA